MSDANTTRPSGRAPTPRTTQGMGPPAPAIVPSTTVVEPNLGHEMGGAPVEAGAAAGCSDAAAGKEGGWSREYAPTDLGFVPPPDAPKVELSDTLEGEVAEQLAPAVSKAPKKGREAAAPTAVMPDVQKRRAEAQQERSDLPLIIGLFGLVVLIVGLATVIAYRLMT